MSRGVVVIGAGMGGLAAAIDLASAGFEVTVLERGPRPGGKANIAEHDGVEFDTGPSVMTLPDAFDAVFRRAGTSLRDEVTLTLPEPASRYHYPDGTVVDVFSDHARTVDAVRDTLGGLAARDIDAFLRYSQQIWDAAAPSFVYGDAPTPGRVLSLAPKLVTDLPRIDALRTMRAGIAKHVRSRHLRWLLERYATYNGSDPARAPATLNCIAHVELGLGVHGVEGGIYALVRALVRVAERVGVTLHCDAAVTGLDTSGGRVVGVRTATQTFGCDAVVANADVAHVRDALLPSVHRRALDHKTTPSMSGWVGVLAARRRADRPGHAVLFPRQYDEEFRDIFDRERVPVEPTVYLCAQEKCHERAGWTDHEPLFVMANAPPEPVAGATPTETWEALEQVVLGRLRDADLIDADDQVVWRRSPAGLAASFPGTRGSLYGAASNDLFASFRRPTNRLKALPGLYLASGSAHPGGGLPLCCLSGQAAARAVVADLRAW